MIIDNESTETKKKDGYERQSEESSRRNRIATPYSGLGKLPPQAVDMEEAVLGALMLERDAFLQVNEFLKAEHFYKDSHQKIYLALQSLFAKANPIDIRTVTAELRQRGELEIIGGAYYIVELTGPVASAANIEFHARIILQKFIQREIIRIGTMAVQHAYEDTADPLQLLEQNQLALFSLSEFKNSEQSESIERLIDESLVLMNKPVIDGITGVGTGFKCMDNFTAGWQKTHLNILGARPAMGKTTLMMQWARNSAVIHNVPTGIFSLEMSKLQLTNRLISNETEIFLEKINKRTLTETDKVLLPNRIERLKMAPLHIDDTPGLSIMAFRSKAIRWKKLYDIGIIFVDYLQLMTGKIAGERGVNRDQELGNISRGLKNVAKELDIPIIALSQLSRGVEDRPGKSKRPQLSDLRESGNIEQDADNVLFLYRPEYYGITQDKDGLPTAQLAELNWAKHRDGALETLRIKFRAAVMRFQDFEDSDMSSQQTQVPFVIRPAVEDEELPF